MTFYRTFPALSLACVLVASSASSADVAPAGDPAKPSAQEMEFFESRVRPVLAENCFKCHGEEKQKAGLRLDSREALLKGTDRGAVVVPGQPDKSRLIEVVRYQGDIHMPPSGKLTDPQIEALVTWVQLGTPWPASEAPSSQPTAHRRDAGATQDASATKSGATGSEGATTSEDEIERARATHWSFKPVRCSALPAVKNTAWVKGPVDRFILAKIEEKGLTPSTAADRRTLIRRASFDLIGLPPSPEEVEAFVNDESPDAFAKLIDRLLASPRYGERWGRYWLDVARYADTKGYAFLEERRFPYSYTYRDYVIRAFNEDLPYDQFVMQQLAADQLPLGEDSRPLAAMGFLTLGRRFINNVHDIIDDRIDVVSRGMLGLTVTCARCHDHKYDPIPTADYYSLYGVFASSVEPPEMPLIGMVKDRQKYEAFERELAKKRETFDTFLSQKHAALLDELRSQAEDYLVKLVEARPLPQEETVILDMGDVRPHVLQRWREFLQKTAQSHHPVFAPWHALAALPADQFQQNAQKLLAGLAEARDPAQRVNALVRKALLEKPPQSMLDAARVYGQLFDGVNKRWKVVWAASTQPASTQPATALADAAEEELRQVLYGAESPTSVTPEQVKSAKLFDQPTRVRLRDLRNEVERFEASNSDSPPRAMTLVDTTPPQEPKIFVRGNPENPGNAVPRQFLAVLSGKDRRPFRQGSGRAELARAIAGKDNPLTARVMVNRIWMHHFGAGLVRTPSDFGARGEAPTHPELLDYMAYRFMEEGWSVKKLHRLIMLSAAYQQSSDDNMQGRQHDPENRLLWRMNRRRLDFEAMRDSLLAVSGRLDLSAGGPAVELTTPPFATRRAVYGFIDRQNLPLVFRMFDFASPDTTSPQRHMTTVPQQALFLMNSPFVIEQARSFVARSDATQQPATDVRIQRMYRLAYGRDPTAEEILDAARFIKNPDADKTGPPPKPIVWQYGYGRYDETLKTLQQFTQLPHWTGDTWRAGPQFPDPVLGHVSLTAGGGHVGNGRNNAAIRRWIAPVSGFVDISGTLGHAPQDVKCGDGVQAWIFSSRSGELGHWTAQAQQVKTEVKQIEVRAGDTIDFIVDCRGTVDCDTFTWAPKLRMTNSAPQAAAPADANAQPGTVKVVFQPNQTEPPQVTEWSAGEGFGGPPLKLPEPLNAWEQYAQVLLLTNEFVFVD